MTPAQIVKSLQKADKAYHNGDESHLTDAEYDALRRELQLSNPTHPYLIGVGSDVRGGKVDLPYPLGSLDQVYEGDMPEWVRENNLADEDLIITEKLDGISALVIYDEDGKFQIAYSRGNGTQGADITRHVKHLVPFQLEVSKALAIRGEIIVPKGRWPQLQRMTKSSAGAKYKNARNAVAGLMNSKAQHTEKTYHNIHFVAYDILNAREDKNQQINFLNELGFIIPLVEAIDGRDATDEVLTQALNDMREQSHYEIDGIVIDVDSHKKRSKLNPTRETLNPAFAVKYKIATLDNTAEVKVVDVEWNVSKDGYLKPRVCIESVELMGVTIQHATGFNAKFIRDNKIGKNAVVQITRSGDVIPYIQKTIKPAKEWKQPEGAYRWSENDVDIIQIGESDEQKIQQLIDIFMKLEIDGLREGNIRKLYEAGYTDFEKIMRMYDHEMEELLGKNGLKISESLMNKMNGIELWKLMGSRTDIFGRGIGRRKMKKLCEAFNDDFSTVRMKDIVSVEGFDVKTAQKVYDGLDAFFNSLEGLASQDLVKIAEPAKVSSDLAGIAAVFTGFRSPELQAVVEAGGGKIQSAVSSKTTHLVTKDPNSTTGKAKKARDLGVEVIGIDEFKSLVGA